MRVPPRFVKSPAYVGYRACAMSQPSDCGWGRKAGPATAHLSPPVRLAVQLLSIHLLCGVASAQICTGDLDGNGRVSISEVVRGVGMALGSIPFEVGTSFDRDGSGTIEIAELIAAVGFALRGCPMATPTTSLPTAVPSPTATRGPSGLIQIDDERVPHGTGTSPHVSDVLIADRVYVANTGSFMAYEINDTGLVFSHTSQDTPAPVRCTLIALHSPSRSLYCAAADRATIAIFDADTARLRSPGNLFDELASGYRDVHVVDDTLYLAAFSAGLLRAPIAADGSLGSLETYLDGDVVGVGGDSDRLVVLDRTQGLRLIEGGQPTAVVPLDAPMLGLVVHDGLAVVALGSLGAVVIDLDSRAIVARAEPPCVAVEADYRDGALAIACSTGLYLYQTDPTIRTAGWDPAQYSSLGARFAGDLLVANDWWRLVTYRVDTNGRAVGLDAPRGFVLGRGQGMRFAVRNPDDQPQHLNGRVIEPLGQLMIEVPPGEASVTIALATDEQGARTPVGVRIARGTERVEFAQPFPLPLRSRYVSFIQPDCALQYPALEDLFWLAAHDRPPSELAPLIVLVPFNDELDWPVAGFLSLWGAPPEAIRLVDALAGAVRSEDSFEATFGAHRFIPGADTTVEFSVDGDGRVSGFDRVYRGAHPLAAEFW